MLDLCRCHLLNVNDDGGEHGLPVAVYTAEDIFVEFDDALGFSLTHGNTILRPPNSRHFQRRAEQYLRFLASFVLIFQLR